MYNDFMDANNEAHRQFWQYLSQGQKDLILEGDYLMQDIIRHHTYTFKDYSFIVFPYAKAYEGFLKTLCKDVRLISHLDYISDHLRLGKLLSPFLTERLGDRSLYKKIVDSSSKELADKIWRTWKMGRNQVFHYFPHNFHGLSFTEAQNIVAEIMVTMEEAYINLNKSYIEHHKTSQPSVYQAASA